MTFEKLTAPFAHPHLKLTSRVVMAPMNRRRAINGIPTPAMVTYYRQRAGAGLIITDNTAVAPNGGAYLHTPGIYNDVQQAAWQQIVQAVHEAGGKIFMQLVHAGRVGHPLVQQNLPLIAPSGVAVNEKIRVPDGSYQTMARPEAITTEAIRTWVDSYRIAALRAVEAGFDGVELHGAHGFLIDQFLNPQSNRRTDGYGGCVEGRVRFLIEVVEAVTQAIGPERTGIRLSPYQYLYGLRPYVDETLTHQYVLSQLQRFNILYIHYSNLAADGSTYLSAEFLTDVRKHFNNLLIAAGGYTAASAERLLGSGLVDLVAFGKAFISNPDLVARFKIGAELAKWDESTFYTGGENGLIDYAPISTTEILLGRG